MADNEIIDLYLPSIKHHHERYDGLGYPDALAQDEIPFFARIISIVDTYDAMTSTRSYRKALSIQHAINEISRGKGKQFDPELCEIFLEIITEKNDKKEKISKFIQELEEEHDQILDLCSQVKEIYLTDREYAYNQLLIIKKLLLKHLQKEDKFLYPPLLKVAENDKYLKNSLDFFVKNINKVSDMFDTVLRIFSENNRDKAYYEENLNKLAILLNERIKKEEGIIFSMYEEKISDLQS
jgi:iron-sulfur cluster repair protein YtfE (RIC family)